MVLEGSFASKDDLNGLRDEFTLFKIDVATQFAELRAEMDSKFADMRVEMNEKFAELRVEMNEKFAEQRADADNRERRIVKWVVGTVLAGIAVNVAVMGIGIGVVALLVR